MKRKAWIVVLLIFFALVFFRFYQLEARTEFRWDQVDNAWVAKDTLVDHKLPLVGMQAKQNSGFFIGPLYYYFIIPFYAFFNLDPIAAGAIAGVSSIVTFFIVFYIVKKLFSLPIAIIAVIIYTFSFEITLADHYQWPVNLIPATSLVIFYALYSSLLGKTKYLLLLGLAVGFSFSLNFTSILFPIIVLLAVPFLPKTRETIKYGLIALLLFSVWLVPNIVAEVGNQASSSKSMVSYINTYFHGFHLTRMLQIASEALIEFTTVLPFPALSSLRYIFLPLFLVVYLAKSYARDRLLICYLIILWFLVPWLIFTTYSGEITNYYFTLSRPIAIMIIAYLIIWIGSRKHILPKIAIAGFLLYYAIFNTKQFFSKSIQGLDYHRKEVERVIREKRVVEFRQGVPESYIYYYYIYKNKKIQNE